MKQPPEFFGERELALIFIAKKLREALALEEVLTRAGIDYLVEADTYRGGVIFQTERTGAFFYVDPESEEASLAVLRQHGYQPVFQS